MSKQSPAQRTAYNVPDASTSRQDSKDNAGLHKRVLLLDFADNRGPSGRKRPREKPVEDAENIQRGQAHREPPDQKHCNGTADRRAKDTSGGVVPVDHGAHDHASKDRRKVEEHDRQRGLDAACAQTSCVRREIDGREEVPHRFEGVACFVDQKGRIEQEPKVEWPGARRARDGETRSDKVEQWAAQNDEND